MSLPHNYFILLYQSLLKDLIYFLLLLIPVWVIMIFGVDRPLVLISIFSFKDNWENIMFLRCSALTPITINYCNRDKYLNYISGKINKYELKYKETRYFYAYLKEITNNQMIYFYYKRRTWYSSCSFRSSLLTYYLQTPVLTKVIETRRTIYYRHCREFSVRPKPMWFYIRRGFGAA